MGFVEKSGAPTDDHVAALRRLEGILQDAGKEALDLFARRNDLAVRRKAPDQLVSEADLVLEKSLRRRLHDQFGDMPVLGEELGGDTGREGWVIDPIDGTSNFIRGLPFWGISVAMMKNGRPVLGGIVLPALTISVCAAVGSGIWLNGQIFSRPPQPDHAWTMALGENAFWQDEERESQAALLRQSGFDVIRMRCAAAALAYSALGRIDGYVETGLRLWDVAAGWLLCEEAGLFVEVEQIDEGKRMMISVTSSSASRNR